MSYSNGLNFLESKTKVLELTNEFGARVAVCPLWNGRIMTSTCNGLEGESFGLIDVHCIESLSAEEKSRYFGGENQFSLSPDGGPFSLYYNTENVPRSQIPDPELGVPIPSGYREGPFDVDFSEQAHSLRMRRSISATNISGAKFDLNIVRSVRLLELPDLHESFSGEILVALEQPEVSYVSYETVNTLVNSGIAFSPNSGLLSIRLRNMFNASPYSVMLIPFREGSEDDFGPLVQSDFYGLSSRKRLHLLPNVALLRADGEQRGQVGISRRRATPSCASIDFRAGVLTILSFNLPRDPIANRYMSNDYFETDVEGGPPDFLSTREHYLKDRSYEGEWADQASPGPASSTFTDSVQGLAREFYENDPYSGEVVRAYNHGPLHKGEHNPAPFYEFDTFSPARELKKGESITHSQWTTHISADSKTLDHIIKVLFQVDLSEVYNMMLLETQSFR